MLLVFCYLIAIVAANLLTARFGVAASIVNAFLFIGLDLSSRDKLHDLWRGNGLIWKMGLLIASGGFFSWFLNSAAGRIAIASCIAFTLAAIVDVFVYQRLIKKTYLKRSNGSNLVSALADSVVFPTIAFGSFSVLTTGLQFAAKVLGGFLWSIVLNKYRNHRE